MTSDHVIALSHLIGIGLGLTLVASAGRSLTRSRHTRVRTEDIAPRRQCLRTLARLIGHLLRDTARLAVNVALVVVAPVGLLCANQRYPLVAPVLAPFEARLAALGHRTGHARCFPLLAWHVWLVRCAGCHRRSVFREVPAPGGTGVELKALGTNGWRTRRCPVEYLTAQPAQAARSARPVRPTQRRARSAQPVSTVQQASAALPSLPHPQVTDKMA